MAARSIWNGTLAFGQVLVPVKVFSLVQQHRVRFREVHLQDGGRIAHHKFGSESGKEVPAELIRRAYEFSPGHEVVLSDEEINAAAGTHEKTIAVQEFVPAEQLDPIYYNRPYVLGTQAGGERPYRVLHDALVRRGKVGIGRFALRSREQLVAVAPHDDALRLYTLHFADELVKGSDVELPELKAAPTAKELQMAKRLIDSLTEPWDPDQYENRYRDAVMSVVRSKAQGEEIKPPEITEPEAAPDLLAALEQSIAQRPDASSKRAPAKRAPAKRAASGKSTTGSGSGGSSKQKAGKR